MIQILAGIAVLFMAGGLNAAPPGTPPDITGVWAQKQVQTSVAQIPVIGEVESKTIAYVRMEVEQVGRKLKVRVTPCWIKIESEIEQIKTIIPAEMIEAFGTYPIAARLVLKDGKWAYYQPPTVAVLGAKLLNPWSDPLPKTAQDPRVIDVDKDGHPGVTVRIYGLIDGAIYLVQRSWSELRGVLQDVNNISGWVRWNTSQVILDATRGPLKSNPNARPHTDARKSRFQMTRINHAISCQDIIINRDALFK